MKSGFIKITRGRMKGREEVPSKNCGSLKEKGEIGLDAGEGL